MVHMATREKSERNGAAADYLNGVKYGRRPRVSIEQLSARTGIGYETLKRQLNNRAEISMDDFITIAAALDVAPRDALRALAEIVTD